MLGQSKTAYQAKIDTPCELIDFWRFNVAFGRQILEEQPISSPGVWNRVVRATDRAARRGPDG
jgi:1-pyrroline-5-carboxylate dehydrogenase